MRRCKRGACGGGDGGGASAFPTWTSLPSQPFSKARASFLDMPVEARSVRASAGGLGEAAAGCPSGELAPGPAHGHSSSAPSPPLEGRASLAIWPAWGPGPGRPGAAAQRLLGRPKGSQVSYSAASTWGLCWVPAGGSSAEGSSPHAAPGRTGSGRAGLRSCFPQPGRAVRLRPTLPGCSGSWAVRWPLTHPLTSPSCPQGLFISSRGAMSSASWSAFQVLS